jgi:hypothetical protein
MLKSVECISQTQFHNHQQLHYSIGLKCLPINKSFAFLSPTLLAFVHGKQKCMKGHKSFKLIVNIPVEYTSEEKFLKINIHSVYRLGILRSVTVSNVFTAYEISTDIS